MPLRSDPFHPFPLPVKYIYIIIYTYIYLFIIYLVNPNTIFFSILGSLGMYIYICIITSNVSDPKSWIDPILNLQVLWLGVPRRKPPWLVQCCFHGRDRSDQMAEATWQKPKKWLYRLGCSRLPRCPKNRATYPKQFVKTMANLGYPAIYIYMYVCNISIHRYQ